MEEKINITEILKEKPQGTKLHDLLYNVDVELDTISTTDTETVVWCTNETDNNTTCHRGYSEFGTVRGCPDGLQILLPSKEMRDWSKFAWKKGDILLSKDNGVYIIFEKFEDDAYTKFKGKHYFWKKLDEEDYSKEESQMLTSLFKKVNDNEAQSYIICQNDIMSVHIWEEFLKKNGWTVYRSEGECFGRKWYKHQDCPFTLRYNNFLGICAVSFNDGKDDAIMIRCIHELQHLLFGLGINHEMEV